MPSPLSQLTNSEMDLLARAKQWPSHADWHELTVDALQEITQQEGIDFATALLYTRLRESPENGAVIQDVEQRVNLVKGQKQQAGVKVLIVPGGFHEEDSDSRECLQIVHGEVTRLGFESEIIPTASFGAIADNAQVIQSSLRASCDNPTLLVALSKGTAEVKWALRDAPELFQNVVGWINVSGLLYGSEWVSWVLNRRLSRLGARFWCWRKGYPFSTLQQLRQGHELLLDFEVSIPENIKVMHIVGFPLDGHLCHRYTQLSFRRLSQRGPNDGMGFMLGDLTRAGGEIYPVWNADHLLRPGNKDMRGVIGPVLDYMADCAQQDTDMPNQDAG